MQAEEHCFGYYDYYGLRCSTVLMVTDDHLINANLTNNIKTPPIFKKKKKSYE